MQVDASLARWSTAGKEDLMIVTGGQQSQLEADIQDQREGSLRPSRRSLLSGLAAAPLLMETIQSTGRAACQLSIVSLDHSLTQLALSLGVSPLGIAQPQRYRELVVEPELPPATFDIGSNVAEPNLELLRGLRPDLILLNAGIASSSAHILSNIAPVFHLESRIVDDRSDNDLNIILAEHIRISEALDRVEEGIVYRKTVIALLEAMRERLNRRRQRPLLVVSGIDQRHIDVITRNSIFNRTMHRLGLRNAWQGGATTFGFSYVGLEQIAPLEEAVLVIIDSQIDEQQLTYRKFWRGLRPVREGRVVTLPPMWGVGGLPVAERFARHLVPALERLEAGYG